MRRPDDDQIVDSREDVDEPPQASGLPPGLKYHLEVVEGPDRGRALPIDRPSVTVGRGRGADLRLGDPTVSGKHFALEITAGDVRLRDLETTNGTTVNGSRTDLVVLHRDDEICVGESRLVLRVTAESRLSTGGARPDPPPAPEPAPELVPRGVPADHTIRDGAMAFGPKVGVVRPDTAIFLEVLVGPGDKKVFDLSHPQVYVIGRSQGDVILDDPKCSTKHAQIQVLGEDQYFLADLASTNGTFLNEIRIQRRRLRHMDVIRIGDTHLRFSAHSGTVKVSR